MPYSIGDACTGCTVCAKVCPTGAARGEKGAKHAIAPALCIDCGACGRSCPASAISDEDGAAVGRLPRARWEKPAFRLDACISCGACAGVCPAKCIDISPPRKPGGGGAYPSLAQAAKCVSCAWCAQVCPVACIGMAVQEKA